MSKDLKEVKKEIMLISKKNIPGRGTEKNKDLKARMCLVCSRSSKDIQVVYMFTFLLQSSVTSWPNPLFFKGLTPYSLLLSLMLISHVSALSITWLSIP